MTSGGNQLALLQASDLANLTAAVTKVIPPAAKGEGGAAAAAGASTTKAAISLSSGSGGQQIVFLSPMNAANAQPVKAVPAGGASAGTTGESCSLPACASRALISNLPPLLPLPRDSRAPAPASLKTLAPAPGASVRLIQTATPAAVSQLTKDGKNVQLIRLVTTGGGGGGSSGGKAVASGAGLRTIAPSPGQKTLTLVPAPGNKAGNLLNLTMTTSPSGQQVIMLPASMLQSGGILKSASTGQNLVPKVSLASSNSQQQLQHPQPQASQPVKSYVPIAPSPLASHATTILPASQVKEAAVAAAVKQEPHQHLVHQQLLNGPSSKVVTISSSSGAGSGSRVSSVLTEDLSRQRKPCNCTKSQCLKLYCDCFANGEFCKDCNCSNCSNNRDHEEERQKAVKQCLERNPHAFQPKIGKGRITGDVPERRHTKGCNCRRSGCLKNYCEVRRLPSLSSCALLLLLLQPASSTCQR